MLTCTQTQAAVALVQLALAGPAAVAAQLGFFLRPEALELARVGEQRGEVEHRQFVDAAAGQLGQRVVGALDAAVANEGDAHARTG